MKRIIHAVDGRGVSEREFREAMEPMFVGMVPSHDGSGRSVLGVDYAALDRAYKEWLRDGSTTTYRGHWFRIYTVNR